jgi:ABC-type Fe3+ transport system permease subunit
MSKHLQQILRWVALAASLLTPALTFAQSCALCYTQAAGSGSRMIAALRSGILILAVPPTVICGGIVWMAYKKRNQFNDSDEVDSFENDEP